MTLSSKDMHNHDTPETGESHQVNGDILHYLSQAHKNDPHELGLSLDSQTFEAYLPFLKNGITWNSFKRDIRRNIKQRETELQNSDRFNHPEQSLTEKNTRQAQLKKELQAYSEQLNQISEIDQFIKNQASQILLLSRDEIKKYFPSFLTLKTEADKAVYLAAHPRLVSLLQTIEQLEQQVAGTSKASHHNVATEFYVQGTEFSSEILASTAEVLEAASVHGDVAGSQIETGTEAPPQPDAPGGHEASGLVHAAEALSHVIVVNNFIRGLVFLREAYEAYSHPDTPQRKTKIAAGLFGGLVSIGAGIVGALLLAGVGLLGTATAAFAAPIVIGAAITGVYAAALYRDSYSFHQINKQVDAAQQSLHTLDHEIAETKETLLTHFFDHLDRDPEVAQSSTAKKVAALQVEINSTRLQVEQLHKSSPNDPRIAPLVTQLQENWEKRNELIQESPKLKEKLKTFLKNDPKLLRQKSQHAALASKLGVLKEKQRFAKKNVLLSAFCTIGVGLALGAVLATGIGAIVLGAIAATALVATTATRLRHSYRAKKKAAQHAAASSAVIHSQNKTTVDLKHTDQGPKYASEHSHEHTSELDIEKKLLGNAPEKVAKALKASIATAALDQDAKYTETASASNVGGSQPKRSPVIIPFRGQEEKHEEEKEGEGEGEHSSESIHPRRQ